MKSRKRIVEGAKRVAKSAWQGISKTRQLASHWRLKRARIKTVRKMVFNAPVEFRTSKGQSVKLLTTGLANVHGGTPETARPIVFCLVDGKLLQFYKSTGRNTLGRKGQWLPFFALMESEVKQSNGKSIFRAEQIRKFSGHPNFPQWVSEISGKIAEAESKGQIKLGQGELELYEIIAHEIFRTRFRIKGQRVGMRGVQRFLEYDLGSKI